MAINFPVDIFDFFEADDAGGLKVVQREFDTTDPRSYQETVGGEAVIGTYGTHLWYGTVTVVPLHSALQRKLESKVRSLKRPDARFYIGDVMDDPLTGLTTSPVLGSVNTTNNHRIRIDSLPVGFILTPGTHLSFDYDGGRRAFHQIGSRAQANASGQATVDVYPILEPGWALGAALTIGANARCKAYMVPQGLSTGRAGPISTEGFTFSWRQTLEL